ncbi:hypothetical protein ACJVDH_14790 [Pedobacter sp. AW1-32]|uniref:hypothetical protein n=1 Tax=Pedobacter sp. AW1-32 TaxID=3383026 RepID=UPI003FEEE5CB
MNKLHKILFTTTLACVSMLAPSCKHSTDDGIELYRQYAIKHLAPKTVNTSKTRLAND